jgi:hypothetical protein
MPYISNKKTKCVYKKVKKKKDGKIITVRGEKVGCTKGNLEDYLTALRMHAESKNLKKMDIQQPIDGAISTLYLVKKPYSGCTLTSLVEPIDPLVGIGQGHEIVPDQVHAFFADEDIATKAAEDLYEDHKQKATMLETKKDTVSKKIKTALDKLEKERREHMKQAKENPKDATNHRDQIAKLTEKIDDLMTKLEKIAKSKKEIEDDSKSKKNIEKPKLKK